MGLVLDSGVLIAAERDAKPVSELLAVLEQVHGETEIALSSITALRLLVKPGLWVKFGHRRIFSVRRLDLSIR